MKVNSFLTDAERLRSFCSAPSGGPHSESELREAEQELGITLPPEYRQLLTEIGTFGCSRLPQLLVRAGHDAASLQTLIPLRRLGEINRSYWQAGMPLDAFAFGLTSTGDALCFGVEGGPTVLYFDHDFIDIRPEADSLTQLFTTYASIIQSY